VRLKAAASFAESGDIHDVVDELWKGAGAKKQTLIDTVSFVLPIILCGKNTDRQRKSIFSSSGRTRHLWSPMT
jgi:hypothetical protein